MCQIERTSEALDQCNCASLCGVFGVIGFVSQIDDHRLAQTRVPALHHLVA